MGNLVRISLSELMATLEILEKAGITPDHFARIRKDPLFASQVIHGFMNDVMTPTEYARVSSVVMEIARRAKAKTGGDELHVIDTNALPTIPNGLQVKDHYRMGRWKWDPKMVRLHLSPNQQEGRSILGEDLLKELAGLPTLNAAVLDYLLAHPELIPEDWKNKIVYFWGTVYRENLTKALRVRCLGFDFDNGRWSDGNSVLSVPYDVNRPAVMVVVGNASRKSKKHIINTHVRPFLPGEDWEVAEHQDVGYLTWDPTKVSLHFSPNQQDSHVISGRDLREELNGLFVLNANVLDYLLDHPELIPEEWKGKAVHFWGTIYRDSGGNLCVRNLYCNGLGCSWGYSWLNKPWNDNWPTAVFIQ